MNQTQVAALIAELNTMPAGLYSCDANGSAYNSYVAQWKVVELVEKHAALAQQAQEPVAWLYVDTVGERYLCFSRPTGGGAITKLYTTPPAPQPAPVDELIEALEDLMDWQVKNVALWHNRAYDRAHRAIKKHRAALQSPAPQTKGQS